MILERIKGLAPFFNIGESKKRNRWAVSMLEGGSQATTPKMKIEPNGMDKP
jgi:hypothetical protein